MSYLNTIPFYVYRIDLKSTGQFYYGSRFAHVNLGVDPKNDLWKIYFTSSEYVKNLINEHGIDAFDAQIIFESCSLDETFWYEQDQIKHNYDNPLCLNRQYLDKNKGHRVFGVITSYWYNKATGEMLKQPVCPGPEWTYTNSNKGRQTYRNITTGEVKWLSSSPDEATWVKFSYNSGKKFWINVETNKIVTGKTPPADTGIWLNSNSNRNKKSWIHTHTRQICWAATNPGPDWIKGTSNSGKHCYMNILTGESVYAFESPGEEWIIGNQTKGKSVWFNPSTGAQIRASSQPGPDWCNTTKLKGVSTWRHTITNQVRFQLECPGPEWIKGATNSNKFWWTDGANFKMSSTCPGEGWYKSAANKGRKVWIKDNQRKMAVDCPGEGWARYTKKVKSQ